MWCFFFFSSVECEHPAGLVMFSRIVQQLVAMVEMHYSVLLLYTDLSLFLHKDKLRGFCLT